MARRAPRRMRGRLALPPRTEPPRPTRPPPARISANFDAAADLDMMDMPTPRSACNPTVGEHPRGDPDTQRRGCQPHSVSDRSNCLTGKPAGSANHTATPRSSDNVRISEAPVSATPRCGTAQERHTPQDRRCQRRHAAPRGCARRTPHGDAEPRRVTLTSPRRHHPVGKPPGWQSGRRLPAIHTARFRCERTWASLSAGGVATRGDRGTVPGVGGNKRARPSTARRRKPRAVDLSWPHPDTPEGCPRAARAEPVAARRRPPT